MAVNFIKKIWLGKIDNSVHSQFTRFSRGIFANRAVLAVSKGKAIRICSTFEFANDFVNLVSGLADVKFSGVVLSKEALDEIFMKSHVGWDESKKKGLFVYLVEGMSGSVVNEIKDKIYCMLLDAEASGISLKIKKRLPKPGKGGKEKVDDKFCILEIDAKFFPQLHEEFLFDLPFDFKKARISHTFNVSSITLPKGEKDFEQVRLKAKRKGKILRVAEVDGRTIQNEKDFEV
jgi:hypothetical protein